MFADGNDIVNQQLSQPAAIKEIQEVGFFFSIYANCSECESSINTCDVEVWLDTKDLSDFGIDFESIFLIKTKDTFNLGLYPKDKRMVAVRLLENESGDFQDDSEAVSLPYVEFDYSNEEHVMNRLKMMLTFN